MTRRRPRAVLAVLALVVAAGAIVVTTTPFGGGSGSDAGPAANRAATSVATVLRRSLSAQTQVDGRLGYAGSSNIVVPAGTAPADLRQAQQADASARAALAVAEAALAADRRAAAGQRVATDRAALASAQATLSGAQEALAAAESSALAYDAGAAYTMLPATGTVVRRDQPLYAVGGRPVLLLYGRGIAWRAFRDGMTPGPDVAELHASLRGLGYGAALAGESFGAATELAIEELQSAHGLPRTGELRLGAVVFEPGAVRVKRVTPMLGAAVQPGPVLAVTSTRHQVTIQLDAARQSEVKAGDSVTVTLPSTRTTRGVVSSVGSVASTSRGSETPKIDVSVRLADPAVAGRLDQAPVTVSITSATVRNALAVPVTALLALAGGGYAVEAVMTGGAHRLVPVELALVDDAEGLVQVTGSGLHAGQRIVVPA